MCIQFFYNLFILNLFVNRKTTKILKLNGIQFYQKSIYVAHYWERYYFGRLSMNNINLYNLLLLSQIRVINKYFNITGIALE